MKLGISTWVWTSPATDDVLDDLIPRIAQHGFDINLSDVGTADTQRRYYYVGVAANTSTGTEARFCATAELAEEGVNNSLQRKSMGFSREIRNGTLAAALNTHDC
jgi:hypothetical protein